MWGIESEGLGQGIQFTIRIPVKYVDEQEQESRTNGLTGHSYKILGINGDRNKNCCSCFDLYCINLQYGLK